MTDTTPLVARVDETIRKHQMFARDDTILIGVSGGADSVCLARILTDLGFRTALAHLNHGLRGPESDSDERFVQALATRLGTRYFHDRVCLDQIPGNLEAAARAARRQFLDQVRSKEGFKRIALAHSRDDRVETFLLHLLRGSGATGLASMRPVNGHIVRPLIEIGRTEIEAYLDQIGQPWRTDATNLDLRFARNRLRQVVLPGLATEFNPKLTDTLSRTIDILSAESDWADQVARDWLDPRTSWDGSALVIDIKALNMEPTALVRRILRASLKRAGSQMLDIGFVHLEQVRSLLDSGKSGKRIELPGSISVERSFDTLVFSPPETIPPDYEYELPIPGRVHIREIGADFEARIAASEADKPNRDKVLVDGESVGRCVKIRNWKNGDFYSPIGLPASKLKTLFRRERIPRRKRRQWPVVVAESSIVWVASFPVSRDFVPTDNSRRIIEFEASRCREIE